MISKTNTRADYFNETLSFTLGVQILLFDSHGEHDGEQLLAGDVAVAVQVVLSERPLDLLPQVVAHKLCVVHLFVPVLVKLLKDPNQSENSLLN